MFKTFVFVGPSAVGKSYVADQLRTHYPHDVEQAQTYTTRTPRGTHESPDRIFVNTDTFSHMVQQGAFAVYGDFCGNQYGFTTDSLHPTKAHILVNAWPALIPQFSSLPHVVLIGMHPPHEWEHFLTSRMRTRGDTADTITRRLDVIRHDIHDLNSHASLVETRGKMFTIENDSTVHTTVIPWIRTHAGLTR